MYTQFVGNAAAVSQVVQGTVTSVASGGILTATINGKAISYPCTPADTNTTAAAAFASLLAASTTPPEFQELTWTNSSNGAVRATAKVAGTPFAGMTGGLVFSASGGAAITQVQIAANSSPSDAGDPQNWRRNGLPTLPQDNDDLILSDSDIPLLWNLDAIASVRLASYTRYQDYEATVGLPEINENGYYEFRPTYLKLFGGGVSGSSSSSSGGGSGAVFNVVLGFGQNGSGPQRERYDFQGQQVSVTALASGQPLDDYAIRILGSNASNAVNVVGTSVGMAMLSGETASLASAAVGEGGLLALGPGVTFSGTLNVNAGSADINCLINSVIGQRNSSIVQGTLASALKLNYPSFILKNRSTIAWLSGCNLQALTLQTGSAFAKQTQAAMTLTTLSIEVDTCTFFDLFNAVTFVNDVVQVNALNSGPYRFAAGRNIRVA